MGVRGKNLSQIKKYMNKKFVIITVFVVSIGYLLNSTGFFRSIEKSFDGNIIKKVNLKGAEDITINHIDSFAIISATNRKNLPAIDQETGGLYFLDLKDINSKPVLLTKNFNKPFAPHGISIYSKNNITTIAAVNHTLDGEFIEIFELNNMKLTHVKSLYNDLILAPNDIVLLDDKTFYFTNDHKFKTGFMRLIEENMGLSLSNVIYYNGRSFKEVATGISYANGINYDENRNLIFVASPRKFEIKVYKKELDNSLTFLENIYCGSGIDNIEFDLKNNLWAGAHPNLLHFSSYTLGYNKTSPSEILKIQYKGKNNYQVDTVYLENGEEMSGATVAAPFNNLLLVGNVFDKHFLILETSN